MSWEGAAAMPGEFDVAVIGIGCRFPGARSYRELWDNLRRGRESIRCFSPEELRRNGVPDHVLTDPHYVRAAGVLEDYDQFDAGFFGYLPREAQVLDPQQRLFLECSWEAFEDAGYRAEPVDRRVGVFGGITINTYFANNVLPNRHLLDVLGEQQVMLCSDKDFACLRVAYKLGLTGPAMVVQAACASSLAAIHVACRSLVSGECDMALAGGASVRSPHEAGYLYTPGGTGSPDGHCRAFDAAAAGSVTGSGAGVLLLKPLREALADGDHIHGVIKGTAVTNDGSRKVGFTAPSVDGQAAAVAEALQVAGVAPETIRFIEAHGTATPLGDPVEVAALARTYPAVPGAPDCALGSIKTNIGHLDAAAGVAGVIKALLAVTHGQIPASLHFRTPHPSLELEKTRFFVNGSLLDWPGGGGPRRAAVNGLGMGGVNSHIIVEEPPLVAVAEPDRSLHVLPLSARSPGALAAMARNLAVRLRARPEEQLGDVAYTLQTGRREFPCRRALVAGTLEEAWTGLGPSAAADAGLADTGPPPAGEEEPDLVFLFPGQGAQRIGMGAALYPAEPVFRETFDACAEGLLLLLGLDLRELVFARRDEQACRELTRTRTAQAAMFTVDYALALLLLSWGLRPRALLGHSVGEYVAACIAGVFRLEDALSLVARRGRLMQELPAGEMVAVGEPAAVVEGFLDPELSLAAINSPRQCVVAGPGEAVDRWCRSLQGKGLTFRRLAVSHAFHSPMMQPAVTPFQRHVEQIDLRPPELPVLSCTRGTWLTGDLATAPGYWSSQLTSPIRFADSLQKLAGLKRPLLLEVGPGDALTHLARSAVPSACAIATLASDPSAAVEESRRGLLEAVGAYWERGGNVDWLALHRGVSRRRIALPTYPFERQRCWLEPRHGSESPERSFGSARELVMNRLNAKITIFPDRIVITTGDGGEDDAPSAPAAGLSATPVVAPASPPPAVAARPAGGPAVTAPRPADLQATISDFVDELAGTSGVDPQTSLVSLGVDSLLMARLLSRLRRSFEVDLSMQELVDARTVSGIAAVVRDKMPAQAGARTAGGEDPLLEDLEAAADLDRLLTETEQISDEEVERELRRLEARD